MAHLIHSNLCKLTCVSAMALATLSSCDIMDDIQSCPTRKLSFNYTYNVKDADAFSSEVQYLQVYMFDKDGKYLDSRMEQQDKFEAGHTMDISDLGDGKYTFVCLARDKQTPALNVDGNMEFTFSSLTPGVSTIDDLTERMGNGNDEENNTKFSALYTSTRSMEIKSNEAAIDTMSLMKCTKTYRIILVPMENTQKNFTLDNFDVRINGSAAYLDYKGDKVDDDAITYVPYNSEDKSTQGATTIEGETVDQALIYDLSSSRMFQRSVDTKTRNDDGKIINDKRIVITDKRNGKVIFDHSLPWFLGLYNSESVSKWENQEYLDRQDYYPIVFYVPDTDKNLGATVRIQSWRMMFQDTDLNSDTTKDNK